MSFLGKACRIRNQPFFHFGDSSSPPNWKQHQLTQMVWKFLADHCGHHIDVRQEHDMTEEMFGYQSIGGDGEPYISFEQYLFEWPGLDPGAE
jgi:hypothetical protein